MKKNLLPLLYSSFFILSFTINSCQESTIDIKENKEYFLIKMVLDTQNQFAGVQGDSKLIATKTYQYDKSSKLLKAIITKNDHFNKYTLSKTYFSEDSIVFTYDNLHFYKKKFHTQSLLYIHHLARHLQAHQVLTIYISKINFLKLWAVANMNMTTMESL